MTELAGLEKHLAYVGDLEVVAKLTDNAGSSKNGLATRSELRTGEQVGEFRHVWRGVSGSGAYGEGYMHCMGSIVLSEDNLLFTHHHPYALAKALQLDSCRSEVERSVAGLDGGVGVVWRRDFRGTRDNGVQQSTNEWCESLVRLYKSLGINGVVLTFQHDQTYMSAYFNGNSMLVLTANWLQRNSLFEPTMSHF